MIFAKRQLPLYLSVIFTSKLVLHQAAPSSAYMEEQETIKVINSLHEVATTVMWGYDDFIVTWSWAASVWGMA